MHWPPGPKTALLRQPPGYKTVLTPHEAGSPNPPPRCVLLPTYLGQHREMVLDTLVCRRLSLCCSCSSLSYPGGLRLKSRSLTTAPNSLRLSIQ